MSINTAREGHQYPPAEALQVSRDAIRAFATAVQATHPTHHSVEAARAAGYSDLVAPPTYAVVVAQRAEAAAVADAELGIDFTRVVHADERFIHHSPIHAGDTLTAQTTVDRIRIMGAGAMVTTRTDISTTAGATHRATVTSSLLVRAEDEEPAEEEN